MNIFFLSEDPQEIVPWLQDYHIGSQMREVAQMLCTVAHGQRLSDISYQPTHGNHPITRWVGAAPANIYWTATYAHWLDLEHVWRYGTRHKSGIVALDTAERLLALRPTSSRVLTHFAIGMADYDARPVCSVNAAIVAYREYYAQQKITKRSKWTKREKPPWLKLYKSSTRDLTISQIEK